MHVKNMSSLRLNFWFALNTTQQRKLHTMGYSHLFCEEILVKDFLKVSKSKKILEKLQRLKINSFRLVG